MSMTLNDLSTSEHYYLRVNLGGTYKYVVYDEFHDDVTINTEEVMNATAFSSLEEAKHLRNSTRCLRSIPNIYIDIIKHTVKVSVVTDEVVED